MTSVAAFLRLLRTAPPGWAGGLLALMILGSLTEGIGLLLLVPLLDVLGSQAEDRNPFVQHLVAALRAVGLPLSLGSLLSVFVALIVLRSLVQHARERLRASLQHRVVDTLRQRCFAGLLGAEWRWIAMGRQADHANLLLTDVSRVGVGLYFGLSLLASLATALAYVGTALALSWQMTLLAMLSGGLVFGALAGHRRAALRLGQNLGSANRALQGTIQESLAGIKLTKILGTEARHLEHFRQTTQQLRDEQLRFQASTSLSRAGFQIGGGLLLAAYLYAGLTLALTPLPELLVLVMVFARLIPLFLSAHQDYHHWLHAMPALAEAERLLDACRQAAEPDAGADAPPIPVLESIDLEGVTLRYEGRDQAALDGISLRFPAHTTTAIMGPSGAGKSTLADVLMGLLTPDSGAVKVDGTEIDPARRMAWRRSVAYVPQDVFLFHDSIRANLLWGDARATEAEMADALRRAAADFVFELPRGLDTVVGDGGLRLSGGERQRIALARALLRRPSLLILDEATSALDTGNEARIRRAIEQLHGSLTAVIIGHRLPTLEHADQVIVLDAGTVKAQGSWAAVRQHTESPRHA